MTRLALVCIVVGILGASCAALEMRGTEGAPGVEMGEGPEARAAQFIALCKSAGFPVVRLEVQGDRTLLRCSEGLSTVVYVRRAP